MSEVASGVARFQVHECQAGPRGVTVTGRELAGTLRLGMRVRLKGGDDASELTVTRIVAYQHELDEVDPGLTALVELSGVSMKLEQGAILRST